MDASHVYVRALALGCFYSHISTRTFQRAADRVAGQLRGDKECPFRGVTKSGRVWRKVHESDARSVHGTVTLSDRSVRLARLNMSGNTNICTAVFHSISCPTPLVKFMYRAQYSR